MGEGYLYTLVENDTDTEITIGDDYRTYTIISKRSPAIVRLDPYDLRETVLPFLRFKTGAVRLNPIFSLHDLHDNVQITIFRDVANTYSCRMTRRTARNNFKRKFKGSFNESIWHQSIWERVKSHLRRMEDLQRKVRIWHNQCTYLLKKFQEGVERADLVDLEACYEKYNRDPQCPSILNRPRPNSLSDECMLYKLLSSMAEGEALLHSCGELSFNRAAFALSSLPPSVPTFSKFALATRELDWIVDFLCCDPEKQSRFRSWKWCEQRCRLVSSCTNRSDALDDDSLEADVRRQKTDREALQVFLDQKFSRSHGNSSFNLLSPIASWRRRTTIQDELEAIWRKRLQPSSCAPGSYSPLDAFVIENPDTSFFVDFSVGSSRSGASKNVQRCKWLGESVALSAMSNVSKMSAKAETGLLARVQHPNVVELIGYAPKEDIRNPNCYRDFYLVTELMESDLHDLITEQLTSRDGTIVMDRPPFHFLVAVDIALQIVEAMIHVHKCRVLHRDIKPRNILASPKYTHSKHSESPIIYYTIKLIDFGSSKMGDEGSHFDSRKKGTTMYMAPEVWESESYSWSADVYSFGLTCYEIFHGRLPWESDIPMKFADIQKVMRGKIWFPFVYPKEMEELIEKCCAQNPSDRPSFKVIRNALWQMKLLPLWKAIPNSS